MRAVSSVGDSLLGRGFGEPAGLLGRLGGRLMASGNGPTERHVVGLAECAPGESVLVLGPGPGVGVRELLRASVRVIAVDPSPVMLEATMRRCRDVVEPDGRLTLRVGTAEEHGAPSRSVDVVISVNNVMLWADRRAGLAAVFDALRPGGRLLVSAHARWLPDGMVDDCEAVGFSPVQAWSWEPPGRGASTATQVRAVRPAHG